MPKIRSMLLLFSIFPKRPLEFYDRVIASLEMQVERLWVQSSEYEVASVEEGMQGVERVLRRELTSFPTEQVEDEVRQRIESIRYDAPFPMFHNADFSLARFCYQVCRAMRPNIVLETGVAYGVTSAFILKALEITGHGILHSVDLPPLVRNAEQFVGSLIPEVLKHRWRLHRGSTKRVLSSLLPQLGQVDIFIRDSLHTYRNMLWELQTVVPYLGPQAIVIADDVDENRAFQDFVTRAQPAFSVVVQEADMKRLFGVSIFLVHNHYQQSGE